VSEAALGVAVPVDPGPHLITAKAPGRHAWSTQIALEPGKTTVRVIIPNLEVELDGKQLRAAR